MSTSDPSKCPTCGSSIPASAPQGLCPTCLLKGATTPAPSPSVLKEPDLDELKAAFADYTIHEMIGRGGMGFVYRASRNSDSMTVALKVLPKELGADPNFAERFDREGKTLSHLKHPNIVAIHDYGKCDPFFYIAMEYIDGLNLRQAMATERFTPDQALEMVPGLCSALTYAHQQGVLHRDIKPENILLDAEGKVKIVDFGISKMVGDQGPQPTLTVTGAQLGTPSYMAPEQIERSSNIDHRADIYSLGVVLYELLTGGLPIGRFAPPSESAPVHPDIDEIVFRALEKDRLRRQQTAEEIQAELRHAGNSPRPQPQSTKLSTPWQTIVGFILAVISVHPGLLGGLIAFYVSMERDWNPSPQEALTSSMAWVASVVLITLATIFGWQGFSKAIRNPERYNGARLAFTAMAIWPVILSTGLLFSLALFPTLFIFRPAAPQLIPLIMMGSSIIIAVVEAKLVSRAWKHLIHKLDAKPLSTMELSVSPGIGKQIAIWAGSIMGLIAILLFLLIVVWQISHQREAETALADARAAEQAAIAATEAEMNRIRMEREMNPQVIERPVPRPSHKPSISEPKSPTPTPLEEIKILTPHHWRHLSRYREAQVKESPRHLHAFLTTIICWSLFHS